MTANTPIHAFTDDALGDLDATGVAARIESGEVTAREVMEASIARAEAVLGPYGGQIASFEWVFSPRGKDGRPQQMFNRVTGAVDPDVAAYWRDHWDIAQRLRTHWPELKPDLDGKIHVYVGTADTFYLDGAAKLLKETLDGLHAKSDIQFFPGKTHFDLYVEGDDRQALLKKIAWEMYGQARPGQGKP